MLQRAALSIRAVPWPSLPALKRCHFSRPAARRVTPLPAEKPARISSPAISIIRLIARLRLEKLLKRVHWPRLLMPLQHSPKPHLLFKENNRKLGTSCMPIRGPFHEANRSINFYARCYSFLTANSGSDSSTQIFPFAAGQALWTSGGRSRGRRYVALALSWQSHCARGRERKWQNDCGPTVITHVSSYVW